MPAGDFNTALANKQRQLIRKSLDGGAFIAPVSADPIEALTELHTEGSGAGAVDTIRLVALPDDYEDLGNLTTDGMAFARSVSQSEVSSFGSITPTRTDITADTGTMVVVAQETKLLTIGLATGADLAAILASMDTDTGEVSIAKPERPNPKHYRVLAVSLDEGEGGEIYIARFMPNAKVTDYAEQAYASGDTTTNWGVTLTAEKDNTLGYAERWIFGGPGWAYLLEDMGFPALT